MHYISPGEDGMVGPVLNEGSKRPVKVVAEEASEECEELAASRRAAQAGQGQGAELESGPVASDTPASPGP